MLGESETRFLRLALHNGKVGLYTLREITVEPIGVGASANAFFSALAKKAPRGSYPRGFTEQPYWTLVGVDGVGSPALMSEDGAMEPRKGGFSIEPFLLIDGKLVTWADVTPTQSLLDNDLPMPSVMWKSGNVELTVDAFARGTSADSTLLARYRVRNTGVGRRRDPGARDAAVPGQSAGAVSQLGRRREPDPRSRRERRHGQHRRQTGGARADAWRFVRREQFDSGSIVERLRDAKPPAESAVHDDVGFASGALFYAMTLAPTRKRKSIWPRRRRAPGHRSRSAMHKR